MTREGYTHIIVPTNLHQVLKYRASEYHTSIAKYITKLIEIKPNQKDSGSCLVGVRGFESPPPHHFTGRYTAS